jgi:hypothetical protein
VLTTTATPAIHDRETPRVAVRNDECSPKLDSYSRMSPDPQEIPAEDQGQEDGMITIALREFTDEGTVNITIMGVGG